MKFFRHAIITLVIFLCSAALCAQESRSTISGSVLDPSGAAVPNANVTAREVRTGIKTATKTDASGAYNIPFLPPGLYTVTAEALGFRSFERKGITLSSGDHPVLDLKLQVGRATESVTVTEDTPMLETANSSTGQSITTKQVEDMPLNGRNPMMLAQLAIGVIATGQPSLVHPFDNGAASAWSIGGSPSQTAEILMDGAPNGTWDNRMAYAPPQDAVQEVKVKAFDADASYGHTQSGTINKVMKTGTNNLHGSAYFFSQPSEMSANDLFSNRKGIRPQDTKLKQYGFTAGGPVYVPKVFSGKNKLFWFLAMEKLNDSQPNSKFLTVPTPAEQTGDFSAIPGLQLFNPYSGKLSGSTLTRSRFFCDASGNPIAPNMIPGAGFGTQAVGTPCNKLPSQLFSPVAMAYLKLYPQPNTAGNSLGQSNYANSITTDDAYNNELGRLDYAMSDRSRLSGNVRHNVQLQQKNNFFGNNTTGSLLTRENWGATLDEVFTINATTVLDARANYSRFGEGHPSPSNGFDPASLGFPAYIASNSTYLQIPSVTFAGNKAKCASDSTSATSFDCFGNGGSGVDLIPSTSYQLYGNITKQLRNHTLKFGVDSRKYILDAQSYGASAGFYTFDNSWTNNLGSSSNSANIFGQDLAAFLLGLPSKGQFDLNTRGTYSSYYYALFVNDDWRIKPSLTINFGIRYDHDTPYSEKLGRTVNGFDTTSANPIAPAAIAAYAKAPNALIPASAFAVPGGLTFAPTDNGDIWRNDSHMVSPRIGFAWTPFSDQKTVLRGGFGIFVQPLSMAALNPVGKYSSTPILNQEGFSQSTQLPVAASFVSPNTTTTGTLSNPFPSSPSNPNRFVQPAGSTAGLATFNGQSLTFLAPVQQNPYSERWTFGIQQAFTNDLVLEIAYIGNHGVHLPVAFTQLNAIPRQYLSTLSSRDAAVATALSANVTNPFKGLLPNSSNMNGSTIAVNQLLAPFPEFPTTTDPTQVSSGVVEQNATIGSSNFNSLNVRVEKRLSYGISMIASYAWSKLIEKDSWLNATDPSLEKRISPFDHTHHFVTAINYTLPIGRGQLLNLESRWLDTLVGGWQVNAIYSYQTGAPLLWENGSSNNAGDYVLCAAPVVNQNLNTSSAKETCPGGQFLMSMPDLAISNRNSVGPALDISHFMQVSTNQFQFHIRTLPTTFSAYRQDGINNFDTSVIKNFKVGESRYFQFRAEAFNVLNHPTFNAPDLSVTGNGSFGVISATANRPRQLQLGARFVF